MQTVKVYFSNIFCDFKYIFDMQLSMTSHKLLGRSHSLLSRKKDTLKCFHFSVKTGQSAAPV